MKKTRSGFTLVEVAVGGAIMVIIGVALAGLQYLISQNQIVVFSGSTKLDAANNAARTMVREIRTMRSGDNGAYPIESATSQSIIFYSDIDYDGQAERIRYFLTGTTLQKGTIDPVGYPVTYPTNTEKIRTVADYVRNGSSPIFYYYNNAYPTDTINNPLNPISIASIAMVQIYLRVNDKVNANTDYMVDSLAEIRMLKNNL
jgi:Tfp pilus assembly protein FimT